MRKLLSFARTTAIVVALAFVSSPALAQDPKKEAAALAAEGAGKFDENDYMGALDSFSRAYALYKVPTIGIYVARCQHALGRYAAALTTYNDVLALPTPADAPKQVKKAVDEAKTERQHLLPQVSWLNVQLSGAASAKILIDGVEAKPQDGSKYVLDPGPHIVIARADGFSDASQQVDAMAGQEQTIALTLAAAQGGAVAPVPGGAEVFQGPTFGQDKFAAEEKRRREEQEAAKKRLAEAQKKAAEDERKRQEAERVKREREERDAERLSELRRPYIIPGYIAAGAGVVALGVSYLSYSSASSTKDELDQQCVNQRCPASAGEDLDSAKSSANLATYTLIGGLVVGGVGAGLLVKGYTMELPAEGRAWNLTLSPAGVSVTHTY